MDEDFIPNFWVSYKKPENLSDKWFWVKDVLDIDTLLEAYYILYPESIRIKESTHYISLPVQDVELIDWWYDTLDDKEAFSIIWRPSICDPEEEERHNSLLGFDTGLIFTDDLFLGEPEEEEDYYDDEEESEDE